MIRLSETNDYRYRGHANYLVAYDHSAGMTGRYTVFLLNAEDPVTIGRELPLKICRWLINDYEVYFSAELAKGKPYYGDRRSALKALNYMKNRVALKGPTVSAKVSKQIARLGKTKISTISMYMHP